MFSSKSEWPKNLLPNNPGVGQYDLDAYNIETKIINNEGKTSSSFHPPIEKTTIKVDLYDPHVPIKEKELPGPAHYYLPKEITNPNLDKYAIKELSESSDSEEDIPAYVKKWPGVKIPGNIGYWLIKERDTFSASYKLSDLDRFGNPVRRKRPLAPNPAPGQYED